MAAVGLKFEVLPRDLIYETLFMMNVFCQSTFHSFYFWSKKKKLSCRTVPYTIAANQSCHGGVHRKLVKWLGVYYNTVSQGSLVAGLFLVWISNQCVCLVSTADWWWSMTQQLCHQKFAGSLVKKAVPWDWTFTLRLKSIVYIVLLILHSALCQWLKVVMQFVLLGSFWQVFKVSECFWVFNLTISKAHRYVVIFHSLLGHSLL